LKWIKKTNGLSSWYNSYKFDLKSLSGIFLDANIKYCNFFSCNQYYFFDKNKMVLVGYTKFGNNSKKSLDVNGFINMLTVNLLIKHKRFHIFGWTLFMILRLTWTVYKSI